MDVKNWFRLVVDLNDDIKEWDDWSEDGLRRLATAVRASVTLNLLTCRHFQYKGFRRHSDEFIQWAILWLADPAGKAVPHV